MKQWQEARKALHPIGRLGPLTGERVSLDFITPAACIGCGDPAETAYRGHPFHITCAAEFGLYVAAVKAGRLAPMPGLSLGPGVAALPRSAGKR